MNRTNILLLSGIVAAALIVGGLGGQWLTHPIISEASGPGAQTTSPTPAENSSPANDNINTAPANQDLATIFKQANNSVVQITSKITTVNTHIIINGNPLESKSTKLGSGFVYDTEGRIITNNHVIDGAQTVDVTFVDGNTYTAKIVGTDTFSDIAVLQITDDFSDEKLVPLAISDSSELQVGDQVIAIGNPYGLSDTMTTGIVSQVGRLLPNQDAGFSIPNVIQTDAAINPGNSGGPLLNMRGEVIGMNTAIKSNTGDFSGIGFAIPSNTITRIVPVLIEKGSFSHPWLGISGTSLTPDIAQSLGLPRNSKGVVISDVVKGGPADKAGLHSATVNGNALKEANIILSIDGKPMKRIEDVIFYIEEYKAVSDNVLLTVERGGQTQSLTVTLEARPLPTQ